MARDSTRKDTHRDVADRENCDLGGVPDHITLRAGLCELGLDQQREIGRGFKARHLR